MKPSKHLLALFLGLGLSVGVLAAETKEEGVKKEPGFMSRAATLVSQTSSTVTQKLREEVLWVHEFFDVRMPGALGKYNLVFELEPKAGDFVRREFVRVPMELRYGFASNWEAYVGWTPVMPNPFDDGNDCRWSTGMGKLGLRRDTTARGFLFPKITFGLETLVPLGEPPTDLIDHYVHLRPYVTGSRELAGWKGATVFLALSYDRAVTCPSRGQVPPDVVRRNVWEIAPGLLYKPGEYGAFFQYGLRFLDEPDGSRLSHLAKVGFIWDMPLEKSRKLRLPGKWLFELGYKFSDEEGEKIDHGIHARVKWRMQLHKNKSRSGKR